MKRYCLAKCDSAADAEDAAAETFCVAWRRAARLLAADSPRAWLFAVARRVVSNQRRSNARQSRLIERLRCQAHSQVAPTVECGTCDPRLDGRLAEALACLSTTDAELIALSDIDGLCHTEIAARLSIPLPRVRDRLCEARRRLRRHLDRLQRD